MYREMVKPFHASEEVVKQAVRDTIDAYAPGGGFVFWASSYGAPDDLDFVNKSRWITEEYDAYEAYLREYMTNYAGMGDGTFDEGARSMALGELDGVGFGADVTQFPFEMYITQFGALSFAEWIAR